MKSIEEPVNDLSETGKVKFTEAQIRFWAHVRGQCWVEEPQESIFPKPEPVAEAINRRSTRARQAPVAFSPNFDGHYKKYANSLPSSDFYIQDLVYWRLTHANFWVFYKHWRDETSTSKCKIPL